MKRAVICLLAIAWLLMCCVTAGGSSSAHAALSRTHPYQHHHQQQQRQQYRLKPSCTMRPPLVVTAHTAVVRSSSRLNAPTPSAPHKGPTVSRRLLQQSKKYPLSVDPDNKGCYVYRCGSGDTIEQIAKDLGVSLEDLRDRNAKNIADWSRINGRFVQICSVSNMAAVEGVSGEPAPRLSTPAPPPAQQAPTPAPAKATPPPAAEKPVAPAPAAPAPAPAAAAPQVSSSSSGTVSISLPSSLSGGVSSSASPEELAKHCGACKDCVKCKDCALCASAPTICFLNRGRASCGTCSGCSSCPSSGGLSYASYEPCGTCAACAECCPSFYSGCSACAMCQYCKYCELCTKK